MTEISYLLTFALILLCFFGRPASSFLPQSTIQEFRSRSFQRHGPSKTIFANLDNDLDNANDNSRNAQEKDVNMVDRRAFWNQLSGSMASLVVVAASTIVAASPDTAHARGLVQFPCDAPLLNTYHMMRAGTTLLEEEDIYSTNPLFLTNHENSLSERGITEVTQGACQILQEAGINPSVIKYSLAASSMETARLVRDYLKVGQNRAVPEFTFMDPRAIGRWDMLSLQQTLPAVIAMDELEAGSGGTGARPPPNEDGTPNETLADQSVRLRQLMSGTLRYVTSHGK
jgi:hypothetical protein